ncbi:ACT domain-containing protein [Candidatus Micrarchaeota archaeon]|nr:ACT domain-containing protein [Candidatus Micrarchaeota archaeon]
MTKKNSNTPRLSDAVRQAVEGLGYIEIPLEMGLINHSALARKIKPALEKKLGQNLNAEAVTMAIHRHVRPKPRQAAGPLYAVIRNSKVELEPDAALIHFAFKHGLEERLNQAKANIAFEGGKARLIDRSNEITVVTQTRFTNEVIKAAQQKPLAIQEKLSLITIDYGAKGSGTPGVLNHFTNILGQAGINIWIVITSYTKTSFLINESDALTAYDRFMRAIAAANTYG